MSAVPEMLIEGTARSAGEVGVKKPGCIKAWRKQVSSGGTALSIVTQQPPTRAALQLTRKDTTVTHTDSAGLEAAARGFGTDIMNLPMGARLIMRERESSAVAARTEARCGNRAARVRAEILYCVSTAP